jgi:hypothetical protein
MESWEFDLIWFKDYDDDYDANEEFEIQGGYNMSTSKLCYMSTNKLCYMSNSKLCYMSTHKLCYMSSSKIMYY